MKTKLLLLLLFAFSCVNAQINVTEGFESGLAPTGWTSEGQISTTPVVTPYTCSGNRILRGNNMSSSNPYVIIYTSSYTSNGAAIAASFKHRSDATSGSVNVYFYYELNNNGTWNLIGSDNIITTTCRTVSANLAAGVIPNGSTVRFRMQINTTVSIPPYFDDFSAIQSGPAPIQTAIAEYSFDNTYTNLLGNAPFSSASFAVDRHGNANGAINIGNVGSSATITGLPYGSTSRSISVWAKTNSFNNNINYIFHYGNSANGNGLALRPTTILYFANASANLEQTNANANNTWVHYVCTYDGTTAKVYKNGVLFSSGAKTFATVSNSDVFKLGLTESGVTGFFDGAIDDLKIYNYVLGQADITSLFTSNTLSKSNFNQNNLEVALYPNPTNDNLNIETALELKSVEIYNVQGQKVLESTQKQINVANLSSGMYMVKIQDADDNVATKRIIKK